MSFGNYTLRSRVIPIAVDASRSVLGKRKDPHNIWVAFNSYNRYGDDENKNWVSPSNVKNYLKNDPVLDWYSFFQPRNGGASRSGKTDLNRLFKKGNDFEDTIVDHLKAVYPNDVKVVLNKNDKLGRKKMDETIQYMKDGVPIICQAMLYNDNNKTFGVADLVVRSDWMNVFIELNPISDEDETIRAPNLNGDWHYRVIDIKWTTLPLRADGEHVLNSGLMPAYKSQLAIYNATIGNIQGYYPNQAYLLGKGWRSTSGGVTETSHNSFSRLGCVDFSGVDNDYLNKTVDAIKWVRNVRYNASTWRGNPPSTSELYPNMCNTNDFPNHKTKKEHADDIKELTSLWMVGPKHRKIGHDNDVYRWDDPRCSAEVLGITGKKTAYVLDKIIDTNQQTGPTPDLLRPKKIGHSGLQKKPVEFYIDFEAINMCLFGDQMNIFNSRSENSILFMIGVGCSDENGEWDFKSFTMDELSLQEESRVLDEFMDYVNSKVSGTGLSSNRKRKRTQPTFYHWSPAEVTMLKTANGRHDNKLWDWMGNIEFVDLCKVFKEEPVTLKGVVSGFGLKDIATCMYKHGMIDSKWDTNCKGGLGAMLDAIKYYEHQKMHKMVSNEQRKIFEDIRLYNEVDCKTMWEIVGYIRDNHM